MKKIVIPIMPPTILAAAILGGGPGVAEVQAATPTDHQAIEHFDVSWCTDAGPIVVCIDYEGMTKVFVLPDGRASLTVNSRLRQVTTANGAVVAESIDTVNEQIRIGFGQDFVLRQIARTKSSGDDATCVTKLVFRVDGPDAVVVNHTSDPDC